MYQVETRISDYEIVQESPYLLPHLKVQAKVHSDIRYFLGGLGELETWRDMSSHHQVIRGRRTDEFPWQCWPEQKVGIGE